jgi:hypothetical protein
MANRSIAISTNVNFGEQVGLPLQQGFNLSTSFLLEMAICLVAPGSASYMLDTLAHPGDEGQGAAQELAVEEGYLPAQRPE